MKIFICFLIFSLSMQNTMAKIRVALSPQCPYVCLDIDIDIDKEKDKDDKDDKDNKVNKYEGYIVDVLKDIFKKDLQLIFLPKLRLKNGLTTGQSDFIVLSSSNTISNSRMVSNSPSLGMSLLGKVAKNKELIETPLHDLRDKNIVLPKDHISQQLVKFYRKKYPEWKTNRVNFITGTHQEARMLKMLKLERTDIVLSDYYSLTTILAKEKTKYFLKPTSYTGFTPIILVGLDKRNKKIYKRISQWLEENRKSGRIKKFLKKYDIEDWNIYDTRF